MPKGYEKIDGKLYPTRSSQQAAYDDIHVYVAAPNGNGNFLYGKKKIKPMPTPQKATLAWPLDKIYITQAFGADPRTYARFGLRGHDGIDLRTRFIDSPLGRRQVMAAAEGWCEPRNEGKQGYGLHVRIHHPDGSMTLYGHLSKLSVAYGTCVSAGSILGLSGSSGFASGPHLHFEYRPAHANANNGYAGAVDPLPFLPPIK